MGQVFPGDEQHAAGGEDGQAFLFYLPVNPCKNLNNYFQEKWKAMKLPGCPTFTDLRTSIASHVSIFLAKQVPFFFFVLAWLYVSILPPFCFQAKYTHGDEDHLKVAKFMCHDVKTADKFYAP